MANEKDDFRNQDFKEHSFLGYQHVDVFFVYSAIWRTNRISWANLVRGFQGEKGWILPRLHDRAVFHRDIHLIANYQPSLVSKRRVLERRHTIRKKACLMLPMNRGVEDKKIEFDLGYTIRIFHDGGMTCTFRACLEKSPNDENASMFEKIHAILHLARNVDYVSPERGIKFTESVGSPSHLTDAYLVGDGEPSSDEDGVDSSLCERLTGRYSLHDSFRRLIKSPPEWAKLKGKAIWDDRGALDTDDPKQDFQAPFVITIAQVDEPSFIRFRQQPTLDDTREVASIMCKLTLDNRSIKSDFLNLSEDYITNVINFNPKIGTVS